MVRTAWAWLLVLLVVSASAIAQSPDSAATDSATAPEGRVIGRIWHSKVDFSRSFEYLNRVREELEIPSSPVMVLMGGRGGGIGSALRQTGQAGERQLKGTLVFLQTKPTIDISSAISFELLDENDSFADYVERQRSMMGPSAEILGEGDLLELRLDFSRMMAGNQLQAGKGNPPSGAPADGSPKPTRTFSIVVSAEARSFGPGEKAPKESVRTMPTSMSTWYRHVDGIVYSSRSKAVHTIELPRRDELDVPADGDSSDLYADFDFTRVPAEIKSTFWSALETQASVWLQRFDNEAMGDYSLRRVISSGRLELLKAVLFDVDRAQFSLNLSEDGTTPIRSSLRVRARQNSPLAVTLQGMSNQRSQLVSLIDEQDPLAVASSFQIPDLLRPAASTFVQSLSLKLQEAAAETPGAEVLIEDLIRPLQETVDSGIMDSAFCLRGTVESGLIPCGAIRMENAELFLSSLEPLLQITTAGQKFIVTRQPLGDYSMISLRADQTRIPLADSQIPVQLNLAATGSWLWMTVGETRAVDALEELLSRHEDSSMQAGQATPLLVRMRLNSWLGTTDDSLSQLPQKVLTELERWLGRTTAPQMRISINGENSTETSSENDAFTSYGAKALKAETSEFELKVRTADQELVVDAKIGTSLVRFSVAQFLDRQSRMFRNFKLPEIPSIPSPQ
jgi:hypothetical protein